MAKSEKNLNAVIGSVVKGEYTKVGLTLESLAEKTGIPYSTLRKKIAGDTALTASEFLTVARAIGIEPGYYLAEAERIFASMSSVSPTTDDITQKRREKEAEARAMTPDQLAGEDDIAATKDDELDSDEPEAP